MFPLEIKKARKLWQAPGRETKESASSMDRVAGQSPEAYFGMLPETFIWSDWISHNGIRVLAVLYGRWTGKFWPVLTNDELSELTTLSAATIKREVSALKKLGLIKVTRTKDGNRYELIKVEFAGDTYRGRINPRRDGWSKVFLSMTASSISSGALRLWLMLDRIGGNNPWAWSSQSALAKYMGVKERQIRVYLDELKEAGLLESRRPDPLGKNEYRLIRTPVMVKVAEETEAEQEQEQQKATRRVARTWLGAVLDDAEAWVNDKTNAGLFWEVWHALNDAIQLTGEEATAEIVDETLKTYGTDYPADFIVKILDEWLTDLGFEYAEPEQDDDETTAGT
ncbi:helix-turn-helix domain-containing protein [Nonomuraea sp. NPDC052129]|uniref:helix-turn-helix domain-containing protein n=1 Tax=Nonomuraea sp. NPDC052129 TaxID=3154651 RepID=UPI0034397F03